MHLVIDLEGAQRGDAAAATTRHLLPMLPALAGPGGAGKATFLICGTWRESAEALSRDIRAILPDALIHTWRGVGPPDRGTDGQEWRDDASRRLRDACLATLRADVVLMTAAGAAPPGSPPCIRLQAGVDDAAGLLAAARRACGASPAAVSGLLHVDRTGIFQARRLKVLVAKLDHLGDFLLAIPALSKLRARYPHADIDAVVGSWNAGLARQLGLFRRVHTFDFFRRRSSLKAGASDTDLAAVLAQLDAYDIAIDLRRQADSRFFIAKVRAAMRVGYESFDAAIDERLDVMLRACRDSAHLRTPLNLTPISLQMLRLVDALPADANDYVSLPPLTAATARIAGRVAIFPKAGNDVREWDPERMRELVARLLAAPEVSDVQLFFAHAQDAGQFRLVADERLAVHAGLEFAAMAQRLAGCSLCIANNSGGAHLAAYLGVPTVGIYSGHELAAEWGPQFHGGVAIHRDAHCAPCHLELKSACRFGNFCLADIGVDAVYGKAIETLRTGEPATQAGDDEIVRRLIADLGAIVPNDDAQAWIEVSRAIVANHRSCTSAEDADGCVNRVLSFRSGVIDWLGFGPPERDFRWTDGPLATIRFYVEQPSSPEAGARLVLVFDVHGRQRIGLRCNGTPVGEFVRSGRRNLLSVPVGALRTGSNRLEIHLPDAHGGGAGDPRQLGIAIRRLKLVVPDAGAAVVQRGSQWLAEQWLRWRR